MFWKQRRLERELERLQRERSYLMNALGRAYGREEYDIRIRGRIYEINEIMRLKGTELERTRQRKPVAGLRLTSLFHFW